ncbi:MAG: TerB family tellurite resistance protein [Prolixibacteraceae bacterium]|nr:TerB family tellurite resistance protein [Prolixibacteraceae bacterium]
MSFLKLLGSGVALALSNEEIRNSLIDIGKKGLTKINTILDADGDGDVDEADIEILKNYAYNLSSILGHAAIADENIADIEEEKAFELIEKLIFSEKGILPQESISLLKINKKDLKKSIENHFKSPLPLKKVSKYAIENQIEEEYYEYACTIVSSDTTIAQDEKNFLEEFSRLLELSNIDKKMIEKKYRICKEHVS